jgi:hypothetical protein
VAFDHRPLHWVQIVDGHRVQPLGARRVQPLGAHGLQLATADGRQVFHAEQRLAVQRGQEADAGIHRPQRQSADHGGARGGRTRRIAGLGQFGDDHGAGAAISFGAAFLGAGAARVLAQPFEHAAGRCAAVDADDAAAVHEADRSGVHAVPR